MKKSIILSAFAALALTASAQIAPAPVRPATIVGSTPLYPVLLDEEGKEYIYGNGDYMNFISVGADDNNSWIEYSLDETRRRIHREANVPGQTIQIAGVCHEWNPLTWGYEHHVVTGTGTVAPVTISYTDTYYKYILNDQAQGLRYYAGQAQWISEDGSEVKSQKYVYITKQNPDGSYYIGEADLDMLGNPIQGTEFPENPMTLVKFIGEKQYKFYQTVAEAIEFLSLTDYRGGCYQQLEDAINNKGVKWDEQAAQIVTYLDLFKTQLFALNVNVVDENDNFCNEFGTKNIQITRDQDGVRYLVIKAEDNDMIQVTVGGFDSDCFTLDELWAGNFNFGEQKNENGEVRIPVIFTPATSGVLDNHVYNADVIVRIAGALSTMKDPHSRMNKSFTIPVTGVNPGMSWFSEPIVAEKNIDFTHCGQTIEVPFFTAGYGITNPANATTAYFREDSRIAAPIATIDEEYAEYFDIAVVKSERRYDEGLNEWALQVTFKEDAPVYNFNFDVTIRDAYSDNTTIVAHVNACESRINVIPEEIKFGAESATQVFEIEYINFNGCNAGKQIICNPMANDSKNITVKFVDGTDVGDMSDNLSGSGKIKAVVTYLADEDVNIHNGAFEEVGYIFQVIDEIDEDGNIVANECATDKLWVSYCVPGLDIQKNIDQQIDAEENLYTMYGEEHSYDLYFKNVYEPYSVYDINVFTDTDLWEIEDIAYTRDANSDEAHITFIVKYLANDECEHDGHITAKIGNREFTRVITLKGGRAKTATGINAVEAESENAAVYNVGGQAVSNSAKGLVIKNGKKFNNK